MAKGNGNNSGFQYSYQLVDLLGDRAKDIFGPEGLEILARMVDRDRQLEDHLWLPEGIFSYAGALATSTSPPWVHRLGGTLVSVVGSLGTAGSTNTVITVYKNGISVGTTTIASGSQTGTGSFNVPFLTDTDLLTVGITTAGTGAADLSVQARFV